MTMHQFLSNQADAKILVTIPMAYAPVNGLKKGEKMLVYGRRNTGKTSVVKNIVGRHWITQNKRAMFVYIDLFGTSSLSQIVSRIGAALAEEIKRVFPVKTKMSQVLDLLKSARPQLSIGADGVPSLTFGFETASGPTDLRTLFHQFSVLHHAKSPVFIVMDEFQDIHQIPEAEGVLRDLMQNLPATLPMVLLGSKKHILSQMFHAPRAPFFNWGNQIEFPPIDFLTFTKYLNLRFEPYGLYLPDGISENLQIEMLRNPEAINRLCAEILRRQSHHSKRKYVITEQNVREAIISLVESRRSAAEEYLSRFTPGDERVLVGIAKGGGTVVEPMGKEFVQRCKVSTGGMSKIIKKLENETALYREEKRYILADPLIREHLVKYRL